MNIEGWIKLHRKLSETDLWLSEPFTRGQAWVDLIMIANHKDGFIIVRGNMVEVKRGQVGWSQERLAKRWKWSRKKVANFLKQLEMAQQIEQQKNNISSIITILNYGLYQKKEPQKEQQENGRSTAEEPQKHTNKNEKKERNIYAQNFESFWKAYPKKKAKPEALKAFTKVNPDTVLMEKILRAIESAKMTDDWKKENGQFIPYPATWLNGQRWLDEVEHQKAASSW